LTITNDVTAIKKEAINKKAKKADNCDTRNDHTSSNVDSLKNESLYLNRTRFQKVFFFRFIFTRFAIFANIGAGFKPVPTFFINPEFLREVKRLFSVGSHQSHGSTRRL